MEPTKQDAMRYEIRAARVGVKQADRLRREADQQVDDLEEQLQIARDRARQAAIRQLSARMRYSSAIERARVEGVKVPPIALTPDPDDVKT